MYYTSLEDNKKKISKLNTLINRKNHEYRKELQHMGRKTDKMTTLVNIQTTNIVFNKDENDLNKGHKYTLTPIKNDVTMLT